MKKQEMVFRFCSFRYLRLKCSKAPETFGMQSWHCGESQLHHCPVVAGFGWGFLPSYFNIWVVHRTGMKSCWVLKTNPNFTKLLPSRGWRPEHTFSHSSVALRPVSTLAVPLRKVLTFSSPGILSLILFKKWELSLFRHSNVIVEIIQMCSERSWIITFQHLKIGSFKIPTCIWHWSIEVPTLESRASRGSLSLEHIKNKFKKCF